METSLQGHIEDFHKESTSIFEEIEQLLKIHRPPEKTTTTTHHTNNSNNVLTNTPIVRDKIHNDLIPTNLDSLQAYAAHDFLIPADLQAIYEEPLLYSVENNELQPITSPHMMPGIYRKIPTMQTARCTNARANAKIKPTNVFISAKESHGRIIPIDSFNNSYLSAQATEEMVKVRPPQTVRLLERITKVESNPNSSRNDEVLPKHWDGLSKLAYNILQLSQRDHIVIDRKRNEIVRTDHSTNQKTIYRFLEPESLLLNTQNTTMIPTHSNNNSEPVKLKLGRPRKQITQEAGTCKDVSSKINKSQQKHKEMEKKNVNADEEKLKQRVQLRTRSGRIVNCVNPTLTRRTQAEDETIDDPPAASAELMRNFLADLKDNDYHNSNCHPIQKQRPTKVTHVMAENNATQSVSSSPAKRRVPPEAICPTCNKIFLGRRLQRHFAQHPDHMRIFATQQPMDCNNVDLNRTSLMCDSTDTNNPTTTTTTTTADEEMTLFRFLVSKLHKSNLNEDQRADLFISEINDLVEQLQIRSSRLIRNTSGLHFVTTRVARVLGIPEGQYALDMAAIESPPDQEQLCMINYDNMNAITHPPPTVSTRSLDYTNLSVSLDNTLTDEAAQKLNLSAGGKLLPPSEESLLRTVNDLVHDGMNKLGGSNLLHAPDVSSSTVGVSTLIPNYDHASDNAVEAVVTMKDTVIQQQEGPPILNLAVDFFQFNSN